MTMLDAICKKLIKIGTLKIRDAEGKVHTYVGSAHPTVSIRLTNKEIERQLLLDPELALGEGYMDGSLKLEEGSLYDLLDLCTQNVPSPYAKHTFSKIFSIFSTLYSYLQQYAPIHRAKHNVEHHYEMKDEFTNLFLDEDKQYSCAYFRNPADTLEQAQLNKKQHIAKKLLLKPGQRILDIGCGWGGMALYLASLAPVEVVGLTLSKEQYETAVSRAKQAGVSDRVKFYLKDYREEKGTFDRIVSVGMFEHVGLPQYQTFFNQVYNLLTKDGLMLLHSIGTNGTPKPTNRWITKYIFPGGYCPSLSEVLPKVEKSKLFINDIEILRHHYAETLRCWRERFIEHWATAERLYDAQFCRMWEFYLSACEVSFRNRELMVFQMQLTRDTHSVPLTRDYLYKEPLQHASIEKPITAQAEML